MAINLSFIQDPGLWDLHVWEDNLQGESNIFLQFTAWYIKTAYTMPELLSLRHNFDDKISTRTSIHTPL